ncbi:MAG: transposase [Candidatus Edwardsbacteria bacterium]
MTYNPEKHHRHSIRFKGYDYSQTGAYFVTICTQNRKCLFGAIVNGKIALNELGGVIEKIWKEIPLYYSGIDIDEFVVMPNHIHGIILIVGADPCVCPIKSNDIGRTQGFAPTEKLSLSNVVQRFKSLTTKKYIDGIKQNNWQTFNKRLWQRNYYEHIIRNEDELNRIRKYIQINLLKWQFDRENPDRIKDRFYQEEWE